VNPIEDFSEISCRKRILCSRKNCGQIFLFLKWALVVTGADIVAIAKYCTEVCEEDD